MKILNTCTEIQTQRLRLAPCLLFIVEACTKRISKNINTLGFKLSEDWPSTDTKEFLTSNIDKMKSNESEYFWGVWLMILESENRVIGDLGFVDEPSKDGIVEIGYNVVPSYRNQGFGFEAVNALTDWASKQQAVKKVIAQCDKDNQYSIRILRKIGAKVKTCEDSLLTWEICR